MKAAIDAGAQSARLHLHAYPEVIVDGRVAPLKLKRALALLAYLSEQHRPVGRESLAALLWPDAAPDVGRPRLRRLVHEMHAAVGRALVDGDGDALWLVPDCSSDLTDTRHTVAALLQQTRIDADSVTLLARPNATLVLSGFTLDAEPFNDWLSELRRAHAAQVVAALELASEKSLSAADARLAELAAAALLLNDRCAEQGYIARMGSCALRGDAAGIEAAYLDCARTLREELGVCPSARVESAYARAVAALGPGDLEIRYAATGAGDAAYAAWGRGQDAIIVLWGVMSNLEVALDEPRARRLLDRLADCHRVVLVDRRGTGLAERVGFVPSADTACEDIEAVLDDLKLARAWLFGMAVGGTHALDFALRRPQRTAGLLLFGASPTGAWSEDWPWALKRQEFDNWIAMLTDPARYSESLRIFAPSAAEDPWVRNWYARLLRNASTHVGAESMLRAYQALDLRERLGELRVPTLVMQRRGDRVMPLEGGRQLALAIPNAVFELLEGEDHFLWHGDSDAVVAAVLRFLAEHRSAAPVAG